MLKDPTSTENIFNMAKSTIVHVKPDLLYSLLEHPCEQRAYLHGRCGIQYSSVVLHPRHGFIRVEHLQDHVDLTTDIFGRDGAETSDPVACDRVEAFEYQARGFRTRRS